LWTDMVLYAEVLTHNSGVFVTKTAEVEASPTSFELKFHAFEKINVTNRKWFYLVSFFKMKTQRTMSQAPCFRQ
jgi:hypothetical protein